MRSGCISLEFNLHRKKQTRLCLVNQNMRIQFSGYILNHTFLKQSAPNEGAINEIKYMDEMFLNLRIKHCTILN